MNAIIVHDKEIKNLIPHKDGTLPTLEDVFLESTGKKLQNPEEEPTS